MKLYKIVHCMFMASSEPIIESNIPEDEVEARFEQYDGCGDAYEWYELKEQEEVIDTRKALNPFKKNKLR